MFSLLLFAKWVELRKLVMMYPVNSERLTSSSVQQSLHMLHKFSMYYTAVMCCIEQLKSYYYMETIVYAWLICFAMFSFVCLFLS
jgi:hypothetical protein